ncbi:MAG: S1 RNA-binding domain-containing protein [Myxococcota bacterium]
MSNAGKGGGGFADMFAEMESGRRAVGRKPRVGQEVTGAVIALTSDAVFVDLGGAAEGLIDRAELLDESGALTVAVGDTVSARVHRIDDGVAVLRTRIRKEDAGIDAMKDALEQGLPVEGKVTGVNKGGLEIELGGGVRAFCPKSQIAIQRVDDLQPYVGQSFSVLVTKVEGGPRPDVVVSRRSLLERERKVAAEALRKTLKVGTVARGTVTSLKDYGAFVDLGGVEGMLHVSELAFQRVRHPREILTVGDELEVKVIDIQPAADQTRGDRISLSLKAMGDDPWRQIPLAAGKVLTGTVTRLEPFGAFVEVAPGVEGLTHISELGGDKRIGHPREVVAVGDTFEVVVKEVDLERRRLSLSRKGAERAREQAQVAAYKGQRQSLGTFADLLAGKLQK